MVAEVQSTGPWMLVCARTLAWTPHVRRDAYGHLHVNVVPAQHLDDDVERGHHLPVRKLQGSLGFEIRDRLR